MKNPKKNAFRTKKSPALTIEFVALFIGMPIFLRYFPAICKLFGYNDAFIPLIPVLLLLTFIVYVFMRRFGLISLRELVDISRVTRRDWARMLIRFTLFAIILSAVMYVKYPAQFFLFPKHSTMRWAIVMVCYPLCSVYPQGIVYRAFYTRRYSELFHKNFRLIVGAIIFSFAHLAFMNPIAMIFTLIGGLFFLSSYNKTTSLVFSGIEHALYGNLMFTIGFGHFFFHAGTLRMMNAL